MKFYHQFLVSSISHLNDALQELSDAGYSDFITFENMESPAIEIGAYSLEERNEMPLFLWATPLVSSPSTTIDWHEQAAQFSPYYKEGLIEAPLSDFSSSSAMIRLKPGAGFGDLSHSTTHLMLRAIEPYCQGFHVIDIGSGSGILSFAASYLKAQSVQGIDIDEMAIAHANENISLNPGCSHLVFTKKLKPSTAPIKTVLMNMTFLEQKQAWSSCEPLLKGKATIITSGILLEQKEDYLFWTSKQGWDLTSMQEEKGWLGFVFVKDN